MALTDAQYSKSSWPSNNHYGDEPDDDRHRRGLCGARVFNCADPGGVTIEVSPSDPVSS